MDRLDLSHLVVVKTIGNRFFLAPVDTETTHRILDVGTGTGICEISVRTCTWVPPNVKFEVDDVECAWIVNKKYDFIFSRAPNGWAEFEDMSVIYGCDDGTVTEDLALMKWARLFAEACQKLGREDSPGPKLEDWVRQAPFKNVVHQHFKIPLGPWPKDAHNKDVRMCNLAQTLEGLDAFTLKLFIGVLGWTREEVVVLFAQVRKDLKNSAIHAYLNYHVVYGQKIEVEEERAAED
ncbi:TAM domain methyltransferase [Colletotrichum acutatum]